MRTSFTSKDVLEIGKRKLSDFSKGDKVVATLHVPDKSNGKISTLTIRLVLHSADDNYLNSEMRLHISDPVRYTTCEIVKRTGNGDRIASDVYVLRGGVVQNMPKIEDDTDVSITEWTILFTSADKK